MDNSVQRIESNLNLHRKLNANEPIFFYMHYHLDNYFFSVPVLLTLYIPWMFIHSYSLRVQYLNQIYVYNPNKAISNSVISLVIDRLLASPEKT